MIYADSYTYDTSPSVKATPGLGHAVLLIHGLSGTRYEVKFLAGFLRREGFAVSTPLLPGHGLNTHQLSKVTWHDWHQEIEREFEALKATYQHVSVVGLCMGAVLALNLAAEKGDRVASLTLLSTTLFFDGWALPWYRALLPLAAVLPIGRFYTYREHEPFGVKNERLRAQLARSLSDAGPAYAQTPLSSLLEMRRLTTHVKRRLGHVTSPALLIHAAEDDVASVRNVEYLEDNLGSAHIEKRILQDSYHLITIDNERAAVASATSGFVRRQALRTRTTSYQAPITRPVPTCTAWAGSFFLRRA